jgi:ribosomal protein S18 acetylase RimI-like enzyme
VAAMDPWQRAIDFLRLVDERVADELVPFPRGRVLVSRRFPLVHDANYVLADRLDGATAAELIEEAERVQGPLGLQHRRVNVDDQAAADRLADEFDTAGYQPERFVIMVHRGPRPELGATRVEPVSWPSLRESRRRQRLPQPWASPSLVEQLLDKQAWSATRVPTRYLGVVNDGLVVASCELRTEGGTAQIETVETLEPYRHRGYARAVMAAALHAVAGSDFIFLVADRDDWPQDFYRRLGFEPVGVESRFLRLLDA